MTDLIKNKISKTYNIVDSKFDSIKSYKKVFSRDIPNHLKKYHKHWGAEPNQEYLLLLFLSKFTSGDLELKKDNLYFGPDLRLNDYNFIKSYPENRSFLNLTVPEALELICPFNIVGSDGGGGIFFFNPTDSNNSIYHSYVEFEAICKIKLSLEEISQEYLNKEMLELFELYKKSDLVKIQNYEGIKNKDIWNLGKMINELNLSLAIVGNNDFFEKIDYQYAHQEFVEYFSFESNYWKSNSITRDINSKLAFAMFFLFLSGEFNKLKELIDLSKNVKGKVYKNLRGRLMKELIKKIRIN